MVDCILKHLISKAVSTVKLSSENCTSLPNVSQLYWDCDYTEQTLEANIPTFINILTSML